MNVSDILARAERQRTSKAVTYTIKKVDQDERLVTGQVYAPDIIDAHGHFITAEDLRKAAHDFMRNGLLGNIDVMHDNVLIEASIVESYIAGDDDPTYDAGAWVATTYIADDAAWEAVKSGELNGYSFEILSYLRDEEVIVTFPTWYYGFTDPDPHDKHTHPFMVRMDDDGSIVWGKTGIGSDGSPAHIISKSSITDPAGLTKHTHRIHLKE